MSRYAAKKYDNRDDIKMILSNLQMPTSEKPKALDSMEDDMDKYIYREDIKTFAKDKRALTKSDKNLYSLVLGHCTGSQRSQINGKEEWRDKDEKTNSLELLKMIK